MSTNNESGRFPKILTILHEFRLQVDVDFHEDGLTL
jgi:hypothetical protein